MDSANGYWKSRIHESNEAAAATNQSGKSVGTNIRSCSSMRYIILVLHFQVSLLLDVNRNELSCLSGATRLCVVNFVVVILESATKSVPDLRLPIDFATNVRARFYPKICQPCNKIYDTAGTTNQH